MAESVQIAPGAFVRCATHPEWGLGQVQSVVGTRVTANFENAGKLVLETSHVPLIPVDGSDLPGRQPERHPGQTP